MVWRKLLQKRGLLHSWAILSLMLALLVACSSSTPAASPPAEATEAPTAEAVEEAAEPTPEMAEDADEEMDEAMDEEATAEATEEMMEEEAVAEATAAANRRVAEEGAMMGHQFAYVGTYTRGAPGGWSDAAEATHPEGVYVYAYDPATGGMTPLAIVPSDNPSWVSLDHAQDNLYVTNEITDYEGGENGSIEAYSIDPATGELTLLNRQPISIIPAQSAVDPTDSFVVVANYSAGTYQLLPIEEDGSLGPVSSTITQEGSGPNENRQQSPHPHAVVFDPGGNFIATVDLGNDMVQIFEIDGDQLVEVSSKMVEPGSGPRHVAFAPEGDFLYVVTELTAQVVVFPFDRNTGALGDPIQSISTVSDDYPADEERSTAEIMVHPSGKFLYNSNRKSSDHPDSDAIVAYRIDATTGELTVIDHYNEGINFPRGMTLDPTGTWLYALNQKGDTIVQFEIDQETGALTPTGLVIDSPVPVSIAFKTK